MSWRTAYNTAYLVSLPLVASPKLLPSVATSDMLGPLAKNLPAHRPNQLCSKLSKRA